MKYYYEHRGKFGEVWGFYDSCSLGDLQDFEILASNNPVLISIGVPSVDIVKYPILSENQSLAHYYRLLESINRRRLKDKWSEYGSHY